MNHQKIVLIKLFKTQLEQLEIDLAKVCFGFDRRAYRSTSREKVKDLLSDKN